MKKITVLFILFLAVSANYVFAQPIDLDDPLAKMQVFTQDVIVQGSNCIGIDCASSESFGFDTGRYKENNLRIHFDDTSSSASFPSNDWRIVINDSSNGGDSYFAIDDATSSRRPFRIAAGAASNALTVDNNGDVGIGTEDAVVELHVRDGDSPTLRLEQDGSSGFTAQTWDVAGNETNFFIRDVNNGSKLPFKVIPNAPDNSVYIAPAGVGIGHSSPNTNLHVKASTGQPSVRVENTGTNVTGFSLKAPSQEWIVQTTNNNANYRVFNLTSGIGSLEIDKSTHAITTVGDITANGMLLTSDLRLKTNIKPFNEGLSIISKLNPISYNFNGVTKFDKNRTHFSIGAQELQEAAPYLVHNFEYKEETFEGDVLKSDEYLKIDFSAMTWVLVNAVKEQQEVIEGLETEVKDLSELKNEVSNLKSELEELKKLISSNQSTQTVTLNSEGVLKQNYPNPHSGNTVIEYSLKKENQNSNIQIYDMTGKLIKNIPLQSQNGRVNLNADDLPAGNYTYSLLVGTKVIDSKKMTISK